MSRLTREQLEYYRNTYDKFDGIESNEFEKICDELIEYKSLEEELGIDLITLFKAIETKIYAEAYHYKTGKPSILDFEEPRLIKHEEWCLVGTCGTFTYCVALKDYKKTWWLKEDLENGNE